MIHTIGTAEQNEAGGWVISDWHFGGGTLVKWLECEKDGTVLKVAGWTPRELRALSNRRSWTHIKARHEGLLDLGEDA